MIPQGVHVHGTGLVIDGMGLVITGPSGSGKSLLALDLIDHALGRGEAAWLVGDDAIFIAPGTAGPVMRAPASIAGLIELRGRGPVTLPHQSEAALSLWVELVETLERLPDAAVFTGILAGQPVVRCPVPRRGVTDPVHQRLLVRAALADPALRRQAPGPYRQDRENT